MCVVLFADEKEECSAKLKASEECEVALKQAEEARDKAAAAGGDNDK